jgi:hypothetical protein
MKPRLPRRQAHFGRPLRAEHREAIRRTLRARATRVREALANQDQLDTIGIVVKTGGAE